MGLAVCVVHYYINLYIYALWALNLQHNYTALLFWRFFSVYFTAFLIASYYLCIHMCNFPRIYGIMGLSLYYHTLQVLSYTRFCSNKDTRYTMSKSFTYILHVFRFLCRAAGNQNKTSVTRRFFRDWLCFVITILR